jgi:hypothetical protein
MSKKRIHLRYTLLGEGTSDRALMPVLNWLICHLAGSLPVEGMWADITRAPQKLANLRDRARFALDYFPADILFIHRDADAQPSELRHEEVRVVGDELAHLLASQDAKTVAVVPIRMMETWLLFDEEAIRLAAGNPHGLVKLKLPKMKALESLPDPKKILRDVLVQATELQGRHRRKFDVSHSVQRVASSICDFGPLLQLRAFQKLKSDLEAVLHQQGFIRS